MNTHIQTILSEQLSEFPLGKEYGHRAVGDKIEAECAAIAKQHWAKKYIKPSSKRSIEDFSIKNKDTHAYCDVKTHYIQNRKGGFSMPNLISVKRLKNLLENPSNTLSYIFVDYTRSGGMVHIQDVHVKYIWELDWSILRVGALGKGQLQIKNANKQLVFTDMGREAWLEMLKVKVREFYKKEIVKINKELNLWK